jgi:cytochrome c
MRRAAMMTLGLLVAAIAASALAGERATTKDAELMVHNAVAFLKKEGREKALAAFSDPKGPFTYRDLYIFVYKLDGTCVAHGAKRDRIGKNLLGDKDADGKEYVRERIKIARETGKGWQEYKFSNPATGKVEQKVAYVELIEDLVIGSGAYKE